MLDVESSPQRELRSNRGSLAASGGRRVSACRKSSTSPAAPRARRRSSAARARAARSITPVAQRRGELRRCRRRCRRRPRSPRGRARAAARAPRARRGCRPPRSARGRRSRVVRATSRSRGSASLRPRLPGGIAEQRCDNAAGSAVARLEVLAEPVEDLRHLEPARRDKRLRVRSDRKRTRLLLELRLEALARRRPPRAASGSRSRRSSPRSGRAARRSACAGCRARSRRGSPCARAAMKNSSWNGLPKTLPKSQIDLMSG